MPDRLTAKAEVDALECAAEEAAARLWAAIKRKLPQATVNRLSMAHDRAEARLMKAIRTYLDLTTSAA